MRKAMGYEREGEFGALAGASKAVVSQWKNGLIKEISPKYAYKFEEKTGFSAKWIQLGEGPQRVSVATEFGNLPVSTYTLIEGIAGADLQEEDILRLNDMVSRLSGKPKPVTPIIEKPKTARTAGPPAKHPAIQKTRIHK